MYPSLAGPRRRGGGIHPLVAPHFSAELHDGGRTSGNGHRNGVPTEGDWHEVYWRWASSYRAQHLRMERTDHQSQHEFRVAGWAILLAWVGLSPRRVPGIEIGRGVGTSWDFRVFRGVSGWGSCVRVGREWRPRRPGLGLVVAPPLRPTGWPLLGRPRYSPRAGRLLTVLPGLSWRGRLHLRPPS